MKGTFLLFFLCLLISFHSRSQSKSFRASIEGRASVTSKDNVPFWMRSNQFGSLPLAGPSAAFIGTAYKDYDSTKKRLVDWGAGFEGRANAGKGSNATLIEGYIKGKLWIFELKGGRMKETFGLTDTLLTTGNFAISGNALGIPKVQIAIPDYYDIPLFGKLFAVKALYAHGRLGSVPIQDKRVDQALTYFHQKAIYGRIGKPQWKLKLYAGFNDQAFYGHEHLIFESFILTSWQKYQSVVFGKNWAFSKVGNHVGNIDLRLDYDFKRIKMSLYRQNFYEVGALYHLANIADGINGVSFVNKRPVESRLHWKKIAFEFLNTKNQAGETWSKPTPSGDENYLNHYLYQEGWSYKGTGLGTPFITAANLARSGQSRYIRDYFINNRAQAYHIGAVVGLDDVSFLAKISYSRNYGTYATKDTFKQVDQLSTYLQADKPLAKGWILNCTLSVDAGSLLDNSFGAALGIKRIF